MIRKEARSRVPIHELIARRWSPRAFDPVRNLTKVQLLALSEAARWAPSCFGDQPWRFVFCDRTGDQPLWKSVLSCLTEKNRRWACNAPVLICAAAAEQFSQNEKANRWAQYDTGAASENICLQATALGLVAHQMGGFDAAAVREVLGVPSGFVPMAVIAVGYRGNSDHLHPDFHAAETGPRHRDELGTHFFLGRWGNPIA